MCNMKPLHLSLLPIAMELPLVISFDNTQFAFEYKTEKELKKARFLFSLMGKPWLVRMGIKLAPWSIRMGLPVKGIIRKTIFSQFVGGETLEQTAAARSEERRVGKECRCRWWPYHKKKKSSTRAVRRSSTIS